jgi:hypothetical protein
LNVHATPTGGDYLLGWPVCVNGPW